MAYASRSGRAQTSSRNPRAFGVCDRCGLWYNHDRLSWQFDWRGASLMNTRVLVCNECLDVPQTQLRAIVLPADPVPIQNPRTENYVADETNYRTTSGQDTVDPRTGIPVPGYVQRITQNNENRVTQETGEPPGGLNEFPGIILNQPGGGDMGDGIGVPYGDDYVPSTGILPGVNYVIWTGSNPVIQPMYWTNQNGIQSPFVAG